MSGWKSSFQNNAERAELRITNRIKITDNSRKGRSKTLFYPNNIFKIKKIGPKTCIDELKTVLQYGYHEIESELTT